VTADPSEQKAAILHRGPAHLPQEFVAVALAQ
jgi:hypothetical protein